MSYDRVAFSDKKPITSDTNGYSDDPFDDRHQNGTRIYNDTVGPETPRPYKTTFTFLCFTCKNTKRIKCIMAASFLVVVASIALIIVSAIAHKNKSGSSSNDKQYGLFVYGPNETGVVDYGLTESVSTMSFFNRIESQVHEYNVVKQYSEPDKYILCDDVRSELLVPGSDKVCMQTIEKFGKCQNENLYGIKEGQPCILIVLKLPEGFLPDLYDLTGGNNVNLQEKLKGLYSNYSVPLTCEGKTDDDKKALEQHKVNASGDVGTVSNIGGRYITYSPEFGFPLYFFRQKVRNADYINPAVMVKFNTIPTHRKITINCTAWAKNFEPRQDYSVEFSFIIH